MVRFGNGSVVMAAGKNEESGAVLLVMGDTGKKGKIGIDVKPGFNWAVDIKGEVVMLELPDETSVDIVIHALEKCRDMMNGKLKPAFSVKGVK